jgi:hypothetical protein
MSIKLSLKNDFILQKEMYLQQKIKKYLDYGMVIHTFALPILKNHVKSL